MFLMIGLLVAGGAGIGGGVVGKAGQVIHGGAEGQSDTAALLIGVPAAIALDF